MPRGRGIYRDEPRDKLDQNIDAMQAAEDDPDTDRPAPGESESPPPVEPPD